MDEVLEVVELVADSGFEGIVAWLFRVVGIVAILVGLGLWLVTDMGLLVLPATLIAVDILLIALPEVLLTVVELGG